MFKYLNSMTSHSKNYRQLTCKFRPHAILLMLSFILLPVPGSVSLAKNLEVSQQNSVPIDPRRQEADKYFEEGLKFFQENTSQSLPQALEKWQKALQIYLNLGDKTKQAETLSGIAAIYNSTDNKNDSFETYSKALKLYEELNDKIAVADTLNSLGLVNADLGKFDPALESYQEALKLYKEAGDKGGEAYTLNNMGVIYDAKSEYQKALDSYNQALPLWREIGEKGVQATTLNNIGAIYDSLGQYQQALDSYNQALEIYQEVGDKTGIPLTLNNMGLVYSNTNEYPKALEFYEKALPLWEQTSNRRRSATTLNNIGFVYANTNNLDKALDVYNKALPLWQQAGDKRGEASTLNNLGFVYANVGDNSKALAYYDQALKLRQEVGDRPKEALTLYRIAIAQRQEGNLEEAKEKIELALEIIEDLRTKVDSQELRASFFASKQDYYEFYIDLLMEMDKVYPNKNFKALALQASERGRARSLLEILTQTGAEIRQGIEPELLEKEQSLQQQLGTLEERRSQLLGGIHKKEQIINVSTEITNLLKEYRSVQAQIRDTSPRYAALTQPQPLTLEEIQEKVLDKDTVLLEYSLGEKRSFLWLVTQNSITSYELPSREKIESAARQFRDAVTVPTLRIRRQKTLQISRALSEIILQPVVDKLDKKRLLIVSDGALQYIPFAALTKAKQSESYVPLIVDNELVSLPSASTIGVLRRELTGRQPASKTLAVLADPVFAKNDERVKEIKSLDFSLLNTPNDSTSKSLGFNFKRLPFTRTEAEEILALVPDFQKTKAFGFAANRDLATSAELSNYKIVHFATHGILNSTKPELSGLVLSLVNEQGNAKNGFLALPDIFNLNLPAELVVLSACETGLGQQIRGEGLVGLTRGFMYAGAARIVVSLWSVDDEATAELMVNFYEGMLQQNLTPTAALRAAQIEMWQQKDWQNPFFWAGFTLQGEWQ
jgi:CHAT domain-containing protein/Tfp pilus assembly protein PilF